MQWPIIMKLMVIPNITIRTNMSHPINTQLAEEQAELEEEVMDSLKAFRLAIIDLKEAEEWRRTTEDKLVEDEKRLSAFKKRMQHD